jgi:adenylyltransferase/sulfurtransferase
MDEKNIIRFSRNILIEEIGPEGQKKIRSSSILVVGAGGLGSAVLFYLTAAGVGKIGIADYDRVDWTNLQRQILYQEKDVGEKKAEVAAGRLQALSEDTLIKTHSERVNADNVFEIIDDYDIIVDGTDTFESKFLLNDACVIGGKTLIHCGILRFEGQFFTVFPKETGCLRCVLPEIPLRKDSPTCQESGILGSVAGLFGSIQATEVLKLITGAGTPLTGKAMYVDSLNWTVRFVEFDRNDDCPVCGSKPTITTPLSPLFYGEECTG